MHRLPKYVKTRVDVFLDEKTSVKWQSLKKYQKSREGRLCRRARTCWRVRHGAEVSQCEDRLVCGPWKAA